MDWWGVFSCCSSSIGAWMEGWVGLCHLKSRLRAWYLLFYALVWTIWEVRNGVVFNGKSACLSLALD